MGRFAKVRTAEAGNRGNYLPHEDARYKVRVLQCKMLEPRKGGLAFIVEFEILEASTDTVKVGAKRSWYRDIGATEEKGGENARADMREFVCQAIPDAEEALDDEDAFEEICEWVVSEDQPVAGMIFDVETGAGKTQSGGPFTHHNWTVADEQEDAA